MEEEPSATCRYFCHMCSRIVRPEMGIEEVKCPHCHSGFVEEMAGDGAAREVDVDADAAPASLFAPTLIDLLSGSTSRRHGLDDGSGDLAAFARRQYRSIAFLQLLSALQEAEAGGDTPSSGRERLVLVNPVDAHAMLTDGNGAAMGSGLTLGDLFVGPGLDALLEYLAETDTNRQGTPPAKKEAVAALPTIRVRDAATCPVCLDQFAAGGEAREMPCKHRFHDGCIVPWLEAHSSCPVCRYQLPTDDWADGNGITTEGGDRSELSSNARGGGDGNGGSSGRRRRWFAWPFGLFSHRSSGSSSSQ
ncbi:hypothetical protein GUJ93_ZPchr0013g34070 [Zizania palustris]|uniref:RING-type E3 ubiquitin transferase n=1 Tax=Zizania palustris TaxID=103762 RepID=A0A8J5WR88_ZIZPA|nr:hypothetical protein GUJ93_ZPchr0013g34070 [Zizania palustris]KAG8096154.1 hypothetical protein GUJ93_ZPchr0013g34070 [Zizania palustris]KAG8096155.1 hypothetical protein GUJ93_ZPchr0013g34070 [Zizania palustris]